MSTQGEDAVLALALARRSKRERLAAVAALRAARLWRRLAIGSLTQSWDAGTGRELLLLVTAAQLSSAQGAGQYVAQALAAQGADSGDILGLPVPSSLAGVAADGRSLAGLLYQPVVATKVRISEGQDQYEAFAQGQRQLQRTVQTEVTDAGRAMDGVALNGRRGRRGKQLGYVRVLMPPSCGRCAILAGSYYSAERAFLRHPRCDCIHLPIGDKGIVEGLTTSVRDYFDSLSKADQDKYFTKGSAQAIRDGADINQAVNARRGMSVAGSFLTRREGPELLGRNDLTVTHRGRVLSPTTRSGITVSAVRGQRLMPEMIYRLASDHDDLLRMLRLYGYLR